MIPKIIHQMWKNNVIPEKWINAVNKCKNLNYQYILWTDEKMNEFVRINYPLFYNVYKSYKYNIQRVDAFRYLVIYKYGGIYIDMDIECKTNLDSLLHYDIVFAKSLNIGQSYTNSFFMSKKEHPFFKYCINNLENNKNSYKYFGKHLHVMNSTGPLFLTKMINNYSYNLTNSYILTKEQFGGDCSVCNENDCIGGIFFKHINGNSWHELDSKIYNILLCNYKKIIMIIIIFILIIRYC